MQTFMQRSLLTLVFLYFGSNFFVTGTHEETFPVRINCGQVNELDVNGIIWEADRNYATDVTSSVSGTGHEIGNTLDDEIYQSERYFLSSTDLIYEFNVNAGIYSVKLHFNELYFNEAGKRVFSVKIQGVTVASDLDLYLTAGHDTAYIIEASEVTVESNGVLTIELVKNIENPQICAIEIELVAEDPILCDESKITVTEDGENIFVDCDFNWYEANTFCLQNFGTTLASVTSVSENDAIRNLCMDTTTHDSICWLGGYNQRDWDGLLFEWIDGTNDISYQKWANNECDNCAGDDTCMAMFEWSENNWDWGFFDCQTYTGAAVCSAESENPQTECDDSKISYTSDGLNIFVDCPFTWFEANEFCLNRFGTTLSSITSAAENEAMKLKCPEQTATTEYYPLCWFGAYNLDIPQTSYDPNEIDFDWIDGTSYYIGDSFNDWAYQCAFCEVLPGLECGAFLQYHGEPWTWNWWPFQCYAYKGASFCNAERPTSQPTEEPTEVGGTI